MKRENLRYYLRRILSWIIPSAWISLAAKVFRYFLGFKIELEVGDYIFGTFPKQETVVPSEFLDWNFDPAFLRNNERLRAIHGGKRMFFLANGPSIRLEKLGGLQSEICMSCSNFYHHPEFQTIRPMYHILPTVVPESLQVQGRTADSVLYDWFHEMDRMIGDASVVLSYKQQRFVSENELFRNRPVYYLMINQNDSEFDITKPTVYVQSAPVMGILLGIFMGFKEIYLLGVDHNEYLDGKYEYFFSRELLYFNDSEVSENNEIKYSRLQIFDSYSFLWKQYLNLKRYADSKNVEIVNLNSNSGLDVFPKANLSEVLRYSI